MSDYVVSCVLGKRGTGKTCLMVAVAYSLWCENPNVKLFANFHLYGIPYVYISNDELVKIPPYLKDGYLFIDEIHTVADAYNFGTKTVTKITTFLTQIRKLHLNVYYTTQVKTLSAKRVRDQTDYIMYLEKEGQPEGYSMVVVYDQDSEDGIISDTEKPVKKFIYDRRPYYPHFDTDEFIRPVSEEEEEDKKEKKK